MDQLRLREAGAADIPRLVAWMAAFYGESGFPLPEGPAARAFADLIGDPRLGRVWIVDPAGADAGYAVLTFAYRMEYRGLCGLLDDLYLQPASRGRGLASAAMAAILRESEDLGLRALFVEVGADNPAAQAIYRRGGFTDVGHPTWVRPLAAPLHPS